MEKRGLTAQLQAADITEEEGILWSDEMRVGLIGTVRRVWASVGVKVVQPLEYKYEWIYLNLGVNGLTGQMVWAWTENMKAISIAPVVQTWGQQGVTAVIWDGARGHLGSAYADVKVKRIEQPPHSPELNPAERVFEFLRDKVEGYVYGKIANKQQAVERELQKLAGDPEAVKRMTGWQWIQESVSALTEQIPDP